VKHASRSNHRFELSRERVFREPRRESMVGIKRLRLSSALYRDSCPGFRIAFSTQEPHG
jgi:hypothetical protein